jgi:hypothetical protein
MRSLIVLAVALAPLAAVAQESSKRECAGAPLPGSDDSMNFKYVRAVVERGPAFEMLRSRDVPISCGYDFGPVGAGGVQYSRIRYAAGPVVLQVERHYSSAGVEDWSVSMEFPAMSEAGALELIRGQVRRDSPGMESNVRLLPPPVEARVQDVRVASLQNFALRVRRTDGAVTHFDYQLSLGSSD